MSHYGKIHEKHLRALAAFNSAGETGKACKIAPVREAFAAVVAELSRLGRKKTKAAPRKKAQHTKREAKHQKTRSVRDEVFTRARLPGTFIPTCEICRTGVAAELHHVFGGLDRRSKESPKTCLALCAGCHRDFHASPGDTSMWHRIAIRFHDLGFFESEVAAQDRMARLLTEAKLDAMRKAGTP